MRALASIFTASAARCCGEVASLTNSVTFGPGGVALISFTSAVANEKMSALRARTSSSTASTAAPKGSSYSGTSASAGTPIGGRGSELRTTRAR